MHVQPCRKVEAVRSVPVSGPAFLWLFRSTRENKWPSQITGRTGFPRGTPSLRRKIRTCTTLPGMFTAASAASALGTALICWDATESWWKPQKLLSWPAFLVTHKHGDIISSSLWLCVKFASSHKCVRTAHTRGRMSRCCNSVSTGTALERAVCDPRGRFK